MRRIAIVAALGAVLSASTLGGIAWARNPHCSGGIQYVVLAMRDKEKGNLEDYQREIAKAVQQLEICSTEDPEDFEAIGYLGWAYAEVDSMRPAGEAFRKAFDGLTAKGDKKKVDMVVNNRESFWATTFNNGINAINAAQQAYPDFAKEPGDDADRTLKAEAQKKYVEAEASLLRALALKPGDARTLRNLGSVHAFQANWANARQYFVQGLQAAPNDSSLQQALLSMDQNMAGSLIDQGKFDEAIAFYGDLVKKQPGNADAWLGLAEAHFKKAQKLEGDARRPAFKAAADGYAQAGALKKDNADLHFNAALAYSQAGEVALAETQWKRVIELRPEDPDAPGGLAQALADQNKTDEAIRVLHAAVVKAPREKNLHRQLGGIYSKAGKKGKSTEELMVFLSLQHGKPEADPAARTKAAKGEAAKTLASMGAPEQVNLWDADGKKYETWYYWEKRTALHFDDTGALLQKSDWSTADLAASKK